ncbi:MAG: dihydrolipoamide acetyltransferase family protein [Candidatus Promineifilaceae bacterium]
MPIDIILPEMGEGVIEGTLMRWLVQPGAQVEAFEPIAEVETDKVTTEILSEVAGEVLELCVAEGETVPVETVVARIGQAAGETSSNGHGQAKTGSRVPYRGRISPLVGRIAAAHQVDLSLVSGTGKGGRITKDDILAYVEGLENRPAGDTEQSIGPGGQLEVSSERRAMDSGEMAAGDELVALSSMRRAIARHMVQSKQTSPHVTTVFEFDFTAVAAHRAANKEQFLAENGRLTYTVYIIAAVVAALKAHPLANSVWTEEGILLKRAINVGMATAVPDGLIVPVIKHADGLNLLGLARSVYDLAERARQNRLRPEEVQDGTFSVTNHGTSGSLLATPIINQPQAGILGVGKIEKRVKVIDDAIAIRPLAYASFTFDHRILDGATADAFANSVKERIENWS